MYLLLASNCNKEIYDKINRAAHFYVDLPTEIHLDGPHAIALREMFYNGYIPSIVDEEIVVRFSRLVDYNLFYKPYKRKSYKSIEHVAGFKVNGSKVAFKLSVAVNFVISGMMIHATIKTNMKGFEELQGIYRGRNIKFSRTRSWTPEQISKPISSLFIKLDIQATPDILKIPSKEYKDNSSLIDEINDMLKKYEIQFGYRNGVVKLEALPKELNLDMNNGLRELLGFNSGRLHIGSESKRKIELNRGIFTFFVYINIVEPMMVGDVNVPLLKVVNYEKHDRPNVHVGFDAPQFMKINRQVLKNIEVQICSDTGELIPFVDGKTSLLVEIVKI